MPAERRIHLERSNGLTACGWDASRLHTARHHDRITCQSCLKLMYGAPRRSWTPKDARGGTDTGVGKLKCQLCGKPYAEHANLVDHAIG